MTSKSLPIAAQKASNSARLIVTRGLSAGSFSQTYGPEALGVDAVHVEISARPQELDLAVRVVALHDVEVERGRHRPFEAQGRSGAWRARGGRRAAPPASGRRSRARAPGRDRRPCARSGRHRARYKPSMPVRAADVRAPSHPTAWRAPSSPAADPSSRRTRFRQLCVGLGLCPDCRGQLWSSAKASRRSGLRG